MARERKVYPRDMVAHLWANKSQDEARDPHGNFYFTGRALYSYGSHFIIAAHADVLGEDGETVVGAVLWNAGTYSVTTGRHQSIARRALPRWVPVFYMAALNENAMRGRGWLLELAQTAASQAGELFAEAAKKSRKSARRDELLRAAETRLETARTLARTIAAGVGDAKGAEAWEKRRARSLLAAFAKLPDGATYADGDNKAQQAFCATCADVLGREDRRREFESRIGAIRDAVASAEYSRDCGGFSNALQQAEHAASMTATAREHARLFRFRMPKLPDIAGLVAALREPARVEMAERAAVNARRWLVSMERAVFRGDAHDARRFADCVVDTADTARRHGADVPGWIVERAHVVSRRASRALAIETAASDLADVYRRTESAESYAGAGHYRDAVREYSRAERAVLAVLAVLPSSHPLHADAVRKAERAAVDIAPLRARFAAEDAAKLAAWRAGEINAIPADVGGEDTPRLRVSRDGRAVETSWGATVPVAVAPMLWRMVNVARKDKESRQFGDDGPRVGSFRLQTVHADGGITVGCHVIAWDELRHIAERLGYGVPA